MQLVQPSLGLPTLCRRAAAARKGAALRDEIQCNLESLPDNLVYLSNPFSPFNWANF